MRTVFSKSFRAGHGALLLLAFIGITGLMPHPVLAQSNFNALQQEALKRGCKKFYDEFKKKDEYINCTVGRSGRTKDSLIDGCFALYHENAKDLRSCLGKYANSIRDLP
jgi:ribosomal protein L1